MIKYKFLKKLWLHSVRLYIQIGLFFYYKNISLIGKETIPKDQPVLFLGNHQNALLDALLIATKSGRFCYYLTRAAVFKKPLVSKLLQSLNMLPVYRVRDGWSTIAKNKSVFSTSVGLLHDNQAITVFPEGSHSLVRRVRPLSKGFTRIILELREKHPNTTVNLIPVGFNYQEAKQMGSRVALVFGQPIVSSDYNQLNTIEATKQIKADVFDAMSKLTTQIPEEKYDIVLQKLTEHHVDFTDPETVNHCIASNFEACSSQLVKTGVFKGVLKPVVYTILCLPVLVWKKVLKPKIKEEEFESTFRFAVCLTLVPFWMLLLFCITISSFGLVSGLVGLISSLLLFLVYNKA